MLVTEIYISRPSQSSFYPLMMEFATQKILSKIWPWVLKINFNLFTLFILFTVLGGWGNSKSAMGPCKGCQNDNQTPTPDILSATEYRQFNVSFANDFVQVSKVGDNEPFMTYQNEESYNVSYIGILTYWGSDGDWIFCGFDK